MAWLGQRGSKIVPYKDHWKGNYVGRVKGTKVLSVIIRSTWVRENLDVNVGLGIY